MLLTAVLAACVAPAYAESEVVQWQTPVFGGTEFKWTGGAGTQDYATAENWSNNAAPSRTSTTGPVLVYDGVTVSVNGGEGVDTSDKGGIKVINGSVVTSTLGRWGGSIFVESGSELTTSLSISQGTQLKNTESADTANVYVGGKLTITNTALNLNDGNTWQNWQIDTYGSLDITAATSINLVDEKQNSYSWNLQYLKSEIVRADIEDYSVIKNRTLSDLTFSQQIINSTLNLSDKFTSVVVIDKTTGERAADNTYSLVYGENGGLSISYEAKTYASAVLETSGDITWKHCGTGWRLVDGDGTDTSFLNGDTVKIVGDGSASLQGNISVADMQVSEGVDYTINMATDASLTVDKQLNNFGGLKITGDDSTSLHLKLSTDAESSGDSRILLSEGSTVGSVYVDGVFAYNTQDGDIESNLGGADLHLNNNGVLLLRNGISGVVDANIGDIYFDGTSGNIRVYGSVSSATIADNIYASSATLYKKDTGTVTLSGTVQADKIMTSGGELKIAGSTTINQLRLSEQGSGNLTISTGGELVINGSNNDHSTGCSILLAHYPYASKLTVNGGALTAADAEVHLSWDGRGTFEVLNGVATVKGLNFWGNGSYSGLAGIFQLGADDGDGLARINIGSHGLKELSYAQEGAISITLSNGIIGATADWTTDYNADYTAATLNLTGTRTGTVFDTTDAIDGKTARTITLNNSLTGSGNLVKRGDGTLVLKVANSYTGTTTIEKGTIKLATSSASLGTGVVNLDGGTLEITKDLSLTNNIDIAGAFIDETNDTEKSGELVIKDGATLTHEGEKIWIGNKGGVKIATGSSFVTGFATIKGIGDGAAVIRQDVEANKQVSNLYTLNSEIHTISSAEVSINSTSEVTLANKLDTVALTNNGEGTLNVTGTENTLTELHALKGNVSVTGQTELVLNALTIAKGNTLTVDTVAVGGSSVVYSAENTGATATLEGGATINGSLNLSAATSLTLDGIGEGSLVNITGDLILPGASETSTLTLSGGILDSLAAMNLGEKLGIFSVHGGFFVGGTEYADIQDATDGIALNTVFSANANINFEGYYLGIIPDEGYSTVYIGKIVPEPTTATLSLLALAALAARRRRR